MRFTSLMDSYNLSVLHVLLLLKFQQKPYKYESLYDRRLVCLTCLTDSYNLMHMTELLL